MQKGYKNYYHFLGVVAQLDDDAIREAIANKLLAIRNETTDDVALKRLEQDIRDAESVLLNPDRRDAYNKVMGLDAVPRTRKPEDYGADMGEVGGAMLDVLLYYFD